MPDQSSTDMSKISVARIAKLAGVSPATVSRVMNGTAIVSEVKIKRVRDAIGRVGGEPKRRITRRRIEQTKSVAIMIIDPDDLHAVSTDLYQTLLHVERILGEQGLTTVFCRMSEGDELPGMFVTGSVSGVLLAGSGLSPELAESLQKIPAVWLTPHEEGEHDVSLAGNEEIGRLAATYFVEQGHRSLGYLQVPQDQLAHATRLGFFEFFAAKAGARVHDFAASLPDFDAKDVTAWDAVREVVREQILRLQAHPDRPTALFVPVGSLTGVVYRCLVECGLQPGRDIDVACCDLNTPMLAGLMPRPAVISITADTVARRAVQELLHRIEHGSRNEGKVRIFIEPRLVPGEKFSR